MRCYVCNSVLSSLDVCESCGAEVAIYKKIVKMSNSYYNMGLAKAKNRDLSGAADLLRRSVRIDKNNIKARNLLGLVYFEMGEGVEALREWVISKNIQPDKNVADQYIKEVQSNPNKLDTMNQTIRKFNKALGYAWEGSDDLAIIQLKKVLALNPRLVKGHQLLSLIYMKKKEYQKAKKILAKAIKIDVCNPLTIRYLKEVDEYIELETGKKPDAKEVEEKKPLSGNDVIIPRSTYKETNYALTTFLNIVIGIFIGAAMVFFLVTPAKEKTAATEYKNLVTEYAGKLDKVNTQMSELEKQIENLKAERDSYKNQLNNSTGNETVTITMSENTKRLIAVAQKALSYPEILEGGYEINSAIAIVDELMALGDVSGESDDFKVLYNSLKSVCIVTAGDYLYKQGNELSDKEEWENSLVMFRKCIWLEPEKPSYMYKLARSIHKVNGGNTDESLMLFKKVIEIAPDSSYAEYAATYIR